MTGREGTYSSRPVLPLSILSAAWKSDSAWADVVGGGGT